MTTIMRVLLLCGLVGVPARAVADDAGGALYRVTTRPLLLLRGMWELDVPSTIKYFSVNDHAYNDHQYTGGNHVATGATTLRLAAGVTDWLQLAASVTRSWGCPDVVPFRPRVEIAGLPLPWVAVRGWVTLPDHRRGTGRGWGLAATGRTTFWRDYMDVRAELDFDDYNPDDARGEDLHERTLSGQLWVRSSYGDHVHLGAMVGVAQTWAVPATRCYGTHASHCEVLGTPSDPIFRWGVEAGYTSGKRLDLLLQWTVPTDWTIYHNYSQAFTIRAVTLVVRVRW